MAIVTTAAGAAALLASLAAGLFIWRKGRIADYPRRDQNNSNNARE
jgi:hypothetical protein